MDEPRNFKFSTQLNRIDRPSPRGPFKFSVPAKISPEWRKLETSNFVHWFAMSWFSIGITDYPLSGRGHVSLILANKR